ncbi:zincin [Artomyces pyxidatus]|uniref:Zincin n=1 Tax=Artomyces pyxidatus TaxID=48021 RepID=A0ACB8T5D0_9AGAM|nr:zincin [Artomyces pyxidatus]
MADSEPRPYTDEESVPVLQGSPHKQDGNGASHSCKSFRERVGSPHTAIDRFLLLFLSLLSLILSSVLIGMFAGAQHKSGSLFEISPTSSVISSFTVSTTTSTITTAVTGITTAATLPAPSASPSEEEVCLTPHKNLDVLYQDRIGRYNKISLTNFTSTIPQINFPEYFTTFNLHSYPAEIGVTYPAYARSLADILNSTDAAVIEAYLVTRVALALAPRLGKSTESRKAVRSLKEVVQGIKPGAAGDRAEYCVESVDEALGFASGRYFVKETFSRDAKHDVTKVITNTVKAFKASLPNISWMDEASAAAAAEKADAIRVKVGYPVSPDTESAASIASYYSHVNISEHTYFDNMVSASKISKEWQQLGKPRDLNAWWKTITPATVNAYYNARLNEVVFAAGILRPPVFSQEWPSYLQYGAFGQVAAHELTHAFDSLIQRAGCIIKKGDYKNGGLTPQARDSRPSRIVSCIFTQYSSYTVDDGNGNKVHVNGKLTSGESIADSGLIQSYRAWLAQYDESFKAENEYLLPGLNFTREQLFFLAFGRMWAENNTPAALVWRVRSDPPPPNKYRVDGTLYNIPEFSKAFNCSAKAKLNPPPEKRCIFY